MSHYDHIVQTLSTYFTSLFILGGMAFSMYYDPTLITGFILFPILCGQISAGIGYNPGFFGLDQADGKKQLSTRKSYNKTRVSVSCHKTSQYIIYFI